MANRWGNSGNNGRFYIFWAPKSLQMVIEAMKLKDAYSLEGKLCNLDSILKSRDITLPVRPIESRLWFFQWSYMDVRRLSTKLMLLNCGVGEDSWESLELQGDPTSPFWRTSVLSVHWEDWCWSWNSNTLVIWCEELTHLKRPWCWERLKAREGDDRGWDGWMALQTQWTWVSVSSGSWWSTGRPGMLQSMGSQSDWATKLNWMRIC